MSNLLYTKIRLPPIRPKHIYRQRLLKQMERDRSKQLVLISAPAGFGKSSCLIEWAHTVRHDGVDVAWYALDDQDNDPTRFTTYLLNAFRLLGDDFESLPHADDQINLHEAMTIIANLSQSRDDSVALILDDFHLITAPEIHDAMSWMCLHLPENMRLVIGTRADPPLHLARLRALGEIAEIRLAELRFNKEELAQWLESILGWVPSSSIINQLETATEGWAAALSLIIMMFKQHHTANDEQFLDSQLARYSQTQRHIFDYFAQEVLEQQSDTIKGFLLDTCVLDRLNPELCEAVTGRPDAPLLLNEIAGESLFIIPLSNTEPVYRYHHLFEGFLRQYQEMRDRGRYLEQHRRAAEWYAVNDSIVEAVQHALVAEDFDYAVCLIEENAWEILTSRGEIMTMVNWVQRFPETIAGKHARLCLYFSRALYLTGHVQPSETYLRLATDSLNRESSESANQQALQAIACNCQATLAAYRGNMETSQHWIEQASALREWVDPLNQVQITNTGAFIRYLMGDVPGARRAYLETLALAEQINNHFLILDVQFYLAQLDLLAGDLRAVQDRCEAVLARYPRKPGVLSPVMLPLAATLYQYNRPVEAEVLLRDALNLAHRANLPDTLCFGHVALSEILLSRSDLAGAEASIAQARHFARSYHSPMVDSMVSAAEARTWLRTDQLQAAVKWAENEQHAEKVSYQRDYEDLTLARVWLAQGDDAQTQALLEQIIDAARAAGRHKTVIEAELLQALAFQASGSIDSALQALERALRLAAPHGFVRLFLDAGQSVLALLRRVGVSAAEGGIAAYAKTLLDAAQKSDAVQHPADALTERQIEVLELMANGASNQDIADTLVISVGTVKSHIHQIMNKLDAQNRTEAVSKARSLNILAE